ncbi:MAG TPA: hypothetical protein VFD84_03270 [Candidatus Binatia bacterium]|jgi:hypothetical protein|nr:hypothetical protein [Candidatus Binatia bacterium]
MKKLFFPLGALAALLVGAPRADAHVVVAFGLPGFHVVAAPPPPVYWAPRPVYYGGPYVRVGWRYGGHHRWRHHGRHCGR